MQLSASLIYVLHENLMRTTPILYIVNDIAKVGYQLLINLI